MKVGKRSGTFLPTILLLRAPFGMLYMSVCSWLMQLTASLAPHLHCSQIQLSCDVILAAHPHPQAQEAKGEKKGVIERPV